MKTNILKLKISVPPNNPKILFRPFLLETLEDNLIIPEGFSRPLTLISAPAGFGKTTLARNMVQEKENYSAWYSLDYRDNERNRFWVYLISSIQSLQENTGKGTLEMLQSGDLSSNIKTESEALLAPLLNDLFHLKKPLFLVLDDYHLINNLEIHENMVFFLENLPPTLHVIVTTRSEPPWPLARWRGKNRMGEIRQKALRFSPEEAEKFFSRIEGLELQKSQIETLYKKTDGWVTGLQLAAISLTNNPNRDGLIDSFAGSHRHVFHFLSEEVFSQQPEILQEFLLQVSILKRFSASLCNTVTNRNDCSELLLTLERNNIFLSSLDEKGEWYRFHPLFADLLLHKLKKQNPKIIPTLLERATTWFLQEGEYGEAIRHCLKAENLEQAAEILDNNLEAIIEKEGPGLVIRALDTFSPGLLKKYPQLLIQKTWFHLVHKGKDEAQVFIQKAEELIKQNPQIEKEIGGMLAVVKAYYYIYSHNFSLALKNAEKAIEILPPDVIYWRSKAGIISGDVRLFSGNPKEAYHFYLGAHRENQKLGNLYLIISSGFKVATTLYFLGRLREAETLSFDYLEIANKEGFSRIPRMGLLWALKGELEREKGEIEKAREKIKKGVSISQSEKPSLGWNLLFKIALAFSTGDFEEGMKTVKEIETLHREFELPGFILQPTAAWKARLFLRSGQTGKAMEALNNIEIIPGKPVGPGQEEGFIALAILLQKENKGNPLKLLKEIETLSRNRTNSRFFLKSLVLQAGLEETNNNPGQAEKTLERALKTGYDSGYFQLFLDEGQDLYTVFQRVLEKKKKDISGSTKKEFLNYIQKITRGISPEKNFRVSSSGIFSDKLQVSGTEEILTERELEILLLLAKGNSNRQVAEILFLSPGTVKWHTSNIYGKLGVRGRTHAIAKARELNLIP